MYFVDNSRSLAKNKSFYQSLVHLFTTHVCSSCNSSTTTMRSLFFFRLTFSLASISHLSLADFDPLQTLALQADDAVTIISTTPDFVLDNPPIALAVGAQDGSSQSPDENSIERNQQQQIQPELFSNAKSEKCRRSPPPARSRGGAGAKRRRKRDKQLNYCPNEDAPTIISPATLQQGKKVPPTGNLRGGQSKPGNNQLVTPEEARSEWAPPLSEFFVTDPCQKRPYRVCAPYVPGRDFEEFTTTVRTLSTFDLRECDFCKQSSPPPPPSIS